MSLSPHLRVMAAPARTYAEALGHTPGGRWLAIRRPALVALVLGTATAFASTQHLTAGLLVSGLVCWSFVPLLQMATAVIVIRPAASRSLPLARRLDLWFMGHAPWSLWMVGAALVIGNAPAWGRFERPIIVSALIPLVWTSVIAAAFCRIVLGDSRGAAIARTALHQVVTFTIALLYFAFAVALWPRLIALAGG